MAIEYSYHPSSTNLKVCSWNSETRIMRILFRSGYLYFFYDVPKRVFEFVKSAGPKGGVQFWQAVGRTYSYRQVNRSNSITG